MQVGARTIVRSAGRDPYYIYIYVYVYIYIYTCCTHGAVGSCYIIQQHSYKTAVPVIIQAGFVLQVQCRYYINAGGGPYYST
jgi:hypothetical protein